MRRFQFEVIHLDRIELRKPESAARRQLDELGEVGWHIAHVRDDAQHNRELLFILERERDLVGAQTC